MKYVWQISVNSVGLVSGRWDMWHQTRDPCVVQVESDSRADIEKCKDRVT